jgi:precorrin-6A synthase
VLVLLDGGCAFKTVIDDDIDIYWGAYLGTPDEILLSGRLGELSEQIETARAQARNRKGWIMDTYLLRKRGAPSC